MNSSQELCLSSIRGLIPMPSITAEFRYSLSRKHLGHCKAIEIEAILTRWIKLKPTSHTQTAGKLVWAVTALQMFLFLFLFLFISYFDALLSDVQCSVLREVPWMVTVWDEDYDLCTHGCAYIHNQYWLSRVFLLSRRLFLILFCTSVHVYLWQYNHAMRLCLWKISKRWWVGEIV